MLSTAKLDSLFSVIVDRKYLIPSLGPNASCFAPSRSNEIAANHISTLAPYRVIRFASCAPFTCTRTLEIFSHKFPMSHNFSFITKLLTGVVAGVARLFLGWQLPPHATPVDPALLDRYLLLIKVNAENPHSHRWREWALLQPFWRGGGTWSTQTATSVQVTFSAKRCLLSHFS